MVSYEEEQNRLRRLMEEVLIYEKTEDSDDDTSQDEQEERQEDSESEQDISDSEGQENVFALEVRIIVTRLLASKLRTRSLGTATDIFRYFINNAMIDIIVENTNLYINSVSINFERNRDARPKNKTKIYAFLGLLIYCGVFKANRLNVKDLWKSDGSGVEIFRLAMSINRFLFLLRCLRFDNKDTREERRTIDKLAPIRDFFDIFNQNCTDGYSPSEYMTIDEKLEGFRGKGGRQYIPSKPNRYGIKIFTLCDAENVLH
ncbi:hypothetical protein NQ314_007203 [Rhamnusium bicolor]|uniref:PiggyBac transposable element-derived protein domain-containing protein n=1 Tax=Rhamnusium bicolor TaxID=1586634 RepID=A0AAV8YR41_9CUCU|nr:hypothetical protein NQ314_007203 [Rhamnusium bicolor]